MGTDSLFRSQVVDVCSRDSQPVVTRGSAAGTGAVSFNGAKVLCEAGVLEI
jgi:hypothetical protein